MRSLLLAPAFFLLVGLGCQKTREPHPQASTASSTAQRSKANEGKERDAAAERKSPPASPAKEAPEPTRRPEPAPPKKKRYVVAALGDSITDESSVGGGYLKHLRKVCPQSQFLDFGKGGDMTNQMRRRYERDLRPQIRALGIDTLIVFGGVNDLYSDLTAGRVNERIEDDLSKIYRSARDENLEVIAITVSPWSGFTRYWNERRGQNTRLLNSWILGQVGKENIDHALDSFPLLSCGEPDRLCPEYETRTHDGLHPGTKGHEILGKKLHEELFQDCL